MSPLQKKAIRYLIALLIIFSLNFLIPRIMPGDPITNLLGENFIVTESTLQALKSRLGLDKSLFDQFLDYWKNILRLDLGYSYLFNQKVLTILIARIKWTLLLLIPSILIGAVVGTFLGALSGWRKNNVPNKLTTALFLSLYSTPPYFLGILCLFLFSFKLALFPLKGFYGTGGLGDILLHLSLPILVMSAFAASRNYLIMRGGVIQERGKLYVLYARAKGLYGDRILLRHVSKNASLPVITLIALDFGFLLSGALFVEIVFSLNGMGTLIYDALLSRDYPVLQGALLVITLMVVAVNFLVDIIYRLLDPRVEEK